MAKEEDSQESPRHQHKDSWLRRALRALPLLGAAYYLSLNDDIPMQMSTSASLPIDSSYRLRVVGFMADLLPLHTIWAVEAVRHRNLSSSISHVLSPTLWGALCWAYGVGRMSPVYFFLHYILTPPEQYRVPEGGAMNVEEVKAMMSAVAVGYTIPILAVGVLPSAMIRPWATRVLREWFPVWVFVFQDIFNAFVGAAKDIKGKDELPASRKRPEMPALRPVYWFGGTASAALSLYISSRRLSSWSWLDYFPQDILTNCCNWERCLSSLALASGLLWEILHWHDLKREGKTNASWFKISRALAGTALLVGPNRAAMIGWACREEVLERSSS